MTKTATPTAIYCRMSKDRTGAGLGVARQEKECRELADRMGLSVVGVYTDNDVSASGKSKPRPGYDRMLADLAAGKVRAVVCWHPDRLTRRTAELEDYIKATGDVPTYTVTAGTFDLTTPAGRATAKTVGAWAQAEVEQKAERQKAKNRQLAQSGKRMPGGPVPFGYSEDRLTPHPLHGELVAKAYTDVLGGKGLAGIAADWQKAGAPVPQSKSGRWDRSSVKRVLLRETNAGLVVHAGKVVTGVEAEWEPLVSVHDFYAVKALLTDPARRSSPGSAPRHLLSGIAVCDSCGHALRRQKVSGKRSPENASVYACSNRKSMRGNCPSPVTVGVEALNRWFTERLLEERGSRYAITAVVSAGEVGDKAASLAELDARIRGIAVQLAEPDADEASLLAALAEAKAERAEAAARPVVTDADFHFTVAEFWEATDETHVEQRRQVVRSQLPQGGLRVKPLGRGRWREPIENRLSLQWVA